MELSVQDQSFLEKIPNSPGVYRFYTSSTDACGVSNNELLYVGKAINLRKRVSSYFKRKQDLSPRISLMVAKITKVEITITDNEVSALVLESNLIKNLKPKYNIVFRDDKSYSLIRISKHLFPRIEHYRGEANRQNHQLFGPYPNSAAVKQSIDLIQRLFKIRTCSDTFFKNRKRPCILYEIKRCSAPCVNYITPIDYLTQLDLAVNFLEGRYLAIVENMTKIMLDLADKMEFELAANYRDKILLINQMTAKQVINNHKQPITSDILICEGLDEKVFIYLIALRNGMYVGDNHFVLENLENNLKQVVEVFLATYYANFRNTAQVYLNIKLDSEFKQLFYKGFSIKISDHFTASAVNQLYTMGKRNLTKIIENYSVGNVIAAGAEVLAQLLLLPEIQKIECIDVSHNHGENAVASLVVYENGLIDHSKYRRYNLSDVVRGNDLLALEIVLKRRLANSEMPYPQVFLVDGGELQFTIAKNILNEVGLYGKIRVIAIFKGEKRDPMQDRVLLDDGVVLNAKSEPVLFKLLHGLRDEAHRFAITGHRKKQINKMTTSQLLEIPNVGAKKRRALITYFGSVRDIISASVIDLCKVEGIGKKLASQIYAYFHE